MKPEFEEDETQLEPAIRNFLGMASEMQGGDVLRSDNGKFELVYHSNGELELTAEGKRVWSSNTFGGAGRVAVGSDGNFNIFDASGPRKSFCG